jgi:hypothetical protein
MSDTSFDIMTDDSVEGRVLSVLRALGVVVPIAFQLFNLFRRPKATVATVGIQTRPIDTAAAVGTSDVSQGK